MKPFKRKRTPKRPGYTLVPETIGKIVDSIWIKDDGTELKIVFAWGKPLDFKPIIDEKLVDVKEE